MAHDLSSFNGSVTMAYFGETPWHRLGQRLTNESRVDVSAAMKAAHLDWTVSAQDVFLKDGRRVEDSKVIVRDQDNRIFGTVGDRFTPIQNSEAFDVLSDVVREAGVTIESAGAIGSGAIVWMLAKFGESREIRPGDSVNPYFLICQAHDGTRSYGARLTPIRVVCQNTLNAATSSGRNEITIRHTRNAAGRVHEARALINRLSGLMDSTVKTYQALASFDITAEDVRSVLTTLFPIAQDATPEAKAKQTKAIAQVGMLRIAGKGSDLSGNSAWGLYNAITEYVDHVKPAEVARDSKSAARRANAVSSAVFGPGDLLKSKALSLTRQLVGV